MELQFQLGSSLHYPGCGWCCSKESWFVAPSAESSVDPGWPPQSRTTWIRAKKALLDLDADRRFEEDDLSSFDEHRPISKHVPEGGRPRRLRVTKRDLMQAIIMSEVLSAGEKALAG